MWLRVYVAPVLSSVLLSSMVCGQGLVPNRTCWSDLLTPNTSPVRFISLYAASSHFTAPYHLAPALTLPPSNFTTISTTLRLHHIRLHNYLLGLYMISFTQVHVSLVYHTNSTTISLHYKTFVTERDWGGGRENVPTYAFISANSHLISVVSTPTPSVGAAPCNVVR